MRELRVKTNKIELQVREYEKEGDAIVFLHFSGANLMMWQRVTPHFQEKFRLILVDLRGHGKSDQPDSGYHMNEMARDVIGVLRYLGIERAHILGSSLGAEVGLSMAANYPEKVISLICDGALHNEYGPYGTWEGSESEFKAHIAEHLEKIRSSPDPKYSTIDALVNDRREIFEKYGWWNECHEALVRYSAFKLGEGKYTKAFGKRAMEDYMSNYYQYRFEEYYKKVQCPLLMLAEKESDDEREKAAMKELCKLASQGQIAEISGWAHPYCWLLDPGDACNAILGFLDELT